MQERSEEHSEFSRYIVLDFDIILALNLKKNFNSSEHQQMLSQMSPAVAVIISQYCQRFIKAA